MKKTLMFLALCAVVISSCKNEGNELKIALHQRDSLGTELIALHKLYPGSVIPSDWTDDLIDTSLGQTMFNGWVNHINKNNCDTSIRHSLAFIVHISDIQAVLKFVPQATDLIVYNTYIKSPSSNDSIMSLAWGPVQKVTTNNQTTYNCQYFQITPNGPIQMLDHTLPCPTCDVQFGLLNNGLHLYP